eukprot:SAG31_NODE_3147_length_4620_cov_1.523114_4_plen_46_part_00
MRTLNALARRQTYLKAEAADDEEVALIELLVSKITRKHARSILHA